MSNSVETSRKVSNSLITFYFAMKLLFFRLLKLISVFLFPFTFFFFLSLWMPWIGESLDF